MDPQTFVFDEGLAVGKPIGIVVAFPADSSQTILFQIVGVLGLNSNPSSGTPVSDMIYGENFSLLWDTCPSLQVGFNATLYNSTFSINGCSGLISVAESFKLNYRNVQNFTVTVSASPDGQPVGTVFANMTLIMNQVNRSKKSRNSHDSVSTGLCA
jgi:hypothetical protein